MDYLSRILHTVVELPEFIKRSENLLSENARMDLIEYLVAYPTAGVLIQGAGGLRKLRWASKGKGKRGGLRVLYYYCDREMPLFLLTVFEKANQPDLSQKECKELAGLTTLLRQQYRGDR